jgi:c-di-GMP-binding flagellar brake protein YcgR
MGQPPPLVDRAPRFPVRVSAEVEVGDDIYSGVTRNLSIGGVAIVITRAVEKGAMLQVSLFPVEDGVEQEGVDGLTLDAEVRWIKEEIGGYSIGLQFQNVEGDKKKKLERALGALQR